MMKILYERERIQYFEEICRRYGKPVDFQFEDNKRSYFFSNGLVITVIEQDGRYLIDESRAGLLDVFKKGEFGKIAVAYSFATSIIAIFSAVLEAYTGFGSYVFTIGLLSSSLIILATTLHSIQKTRP